MDQNLFNQLEYINKIKLTNLINENNIENISKFTREFTHLNKIIHK